MTDNNSEIDVDVVLASGASVAEVNKLALSLGKVFEQGTSLEKSLNTLFSVKLPKQVAALRQQLEGVLAEAEATAKGIGNVPVRELNRRLGTATGILKSGGADTAFQTAAQAGEIARIRNDGAARILAAERETNRVLAARAEIYRRIAEQGDLQGSSGGQVNAAYGRAARKLGDTREGQVILDEARQFEAQRTEVARVGAQKTLLTQSAAHNRQLADEEAFSAKYERAEANHFNRQFELRARADARDADRLAKKNAAALSSDESFWAKQERREAEHFNRVYDRSNRAGPHTDEQIATRSLSIQRARQTAGGGLPFLQTQLGTLAGFASIGLVIGGVTSAGRAVIQFEAALQELQAVSRATDPEMKVLSKSILEVGANSKFSLKDISDASIAIAQAGFAAGDVAKILPAVNNLAAATGSTLKDSAALTTSILSIYALSTERTADVANTLAAAANNSKLTLGQVSTATQYAGAIAAQTGVKFDELITSFANMAQAGAKSGNIIGTGTRALLKELSDPSAKLQAELAHLGLTVDDVNVRTQGFAGALKNLKDAGFSTDIALRSLSARASNAYALNYKGIDSFDAFRLSITGTTAATTAAAIQMQSLQAQSNRLGNSIVSFVNTAGTPFITVLTGMVRGLAGVVNGATTIAPVFAVLGTVLGSLVAANILVWLGGLAKAFLANSAALKILNVDAIAAALAEGELGVASTLAATGIAELTAAMLANPVVLITAGIAALVGVLFGAQIATGLAKAEIDKYTAAANEAGQEVAKYTGRVNELDAEINSLSDRHARLTEKTGEVTAATAIAQRKFQEFGGTLDGVGGHVDSLIAKLQALKKVQLENLILAQRNQLTAAQTALDKSSSLLGGQLGRARHGADDLLNGGVLNDNDRRVLGPQGLAALRAFAQGKTNDPAAFTAAVSVLQAALPKLSGGARLVGQRNLNQLNEAGPTLQQTVEQQGKVSGLTADLGASTLVHSPAAQALQAQSTAAHNHYQDLLRKAALLKPGADRTAALAAAEQFAVSSVKDIRASAATTPGLDQVLTGNESFDALRNGAGGAEGPQTEGGFKTRLALANAKLRSAKANHNVAGIRAAHAQLDEIHRQQREAKANSDPEGALADEENSSEADALNTQTDVDRANRHGGGGGAARRALRNAGNTAKYTAADIKDQIETLAGSTGPSNLLVNDLQLQKLFGEYSTQGRKEITDKNAASRGGPEELAAQLKAFDDETRKYTAKILHTTIAEAAAVLAAEAERAANTGAGAADNELRTGKGNLKDAISDTQKAFNEVLRLQLQASDEKFLAEGHNPSSWSDSLKARAAIIEKYGKDTLDATMAHIDAALKGDALRQQSERYQFETDLSRQRSSLRAANSQLGRYEVGDTNRSYQEIIDRPRAISQARFDVNDAQSSISSLQRGRSALNDQLAGATPAQANELKAKIEDADHAIEAANAHLRDTQVIFDGLTVHADKFQTIGQALAAVVKVLQDQTGKPVLEGFADGLVGVFNSAQQSFATLISSVLSGTQSMAGAFKAFAVSVLQSMLDMMAKLAAQQLFSFILNSLAKFLPGGGGAGAAVGSAGLHEPISGFRMGGMVRRAQGGGSPYRDSVHALLMPGEVVMNRSAVSMMGEDNLLQMNARGNSRMSDVHNTMRHVTPREPDMVNVYVVAPGQQPQLGKKDVVAMISNDILQGGQTKQLIRAVAVGAA